MYMYSHSESWVDWLLVWVDWQTLLRGTPPTQLPAWTPCSLRYSPSLQTDNCTVYYVHVCLSTRRPLQSKRGLCNRLGNSWIADLPPSNRYIHVRTCTYTCMWSTEICHQCRHTCIYVLTLCFRWQRAMLRVTALTCRQSLLPSHTTESRLRER